jgi:DNA repair photolyase
MKLRLVPKRGSTLHDFPYAGAGRKCLHAWIINVTPPGYDHCRHQCRYCYAREAVFSRPPTGVTEIYDNLAELAERELARRRLCPPVLVSNTTDPCQDIAALRSEVARLVGVLVGHGVSLGIITKGDARFLLGVPGFVEHERAFVAVTIEGPPEVLERLSPGAPRFEQRLAVVAELARAGVRTSVRLDPLFPHLYQALYGDRWWETVERLLGAFAAAGCRHVVGGTGRLSKRVAAVSADGLSLHERLRRIIEEASPAAAGAFADEYAYERGDTSAGWRWRRDLRLAFHRRVRAACHELGMTYASCQEHRAEESDSPGLPNCEGFEVPFVRRGADGRFRPVAGCTAACHLACGDGRTPPCGQPSLVKPGPFRPGELR